MNISTILAGMSTINKIVPIIEEVGKEIGPLVEKEVKDGKQVWADVQAAFLDLKAAFAAVQSAAKNLPAAK